MSPHTRTNTILLSRHGQSALAAAASLMFGAALGLQMWAATASVISAVAIAVGVAIFSMALFRIALDGSCVVRRVLGTPRFVDQEARLCDDSSAMSVQVVDRDDPLAHDVDVEDEEIALELPTNEWKLPVRSALVQAA